MPSTPTPATGKERLFRLIPAFDSLRTYQLRDARADVLAGLTVAAVAVPQAMAYAMIAGLPAEYGLYTAVVMTLVGALFAPSRQLIHGPTNAISIAALSVLTPIAAADQRVPAAILLAFMVGAIQVGITLLRLGDLSRYISHSVILGFTTGASALLVLDQLKNLLGLKAIGGVHDSFLERFYRTMTENERIHEPTTWIGIGAIVLVLLMRWLKGRLRMPLFPELLAVVMIAAALVSQLGLDKQGVKVVGEIPAHLPAFAWPQFERDMMRSIASGAFAIALLGLIEAISMAKAIAQVTRQRLDMNQQCLSEGLANLAGSFFNCFPGSGSLTRSYINQQAGAVTQWSGVVSAIAVAVTMLLFAPFARYIPRSALAGILMVAAFKMVDWRALVYYVRATRFDAIIVVATGLSALLISVEFCVVIGVFLSFMLAVPRVGRVLLTEFVVTDSGVVLERLPDDESCKKILIFGLEGELFFGASSDVEKHLDTIEGRIEPQTKVVVLRMKRVRNPDAVGLHLLDDFIEHMGKKNIQVLMCGVRAELLTRLKQARMHERVGEKNLFIEQPVRQTSTQLAVNYAYELIGGPLCEHCPRRKTSKPPLDFVI